MAIATLTSKGQITLPKEVRDALGLEAGTKVLFVRLPSGVWTMSARTGTVDDFLGMLHDPKRPTMTIDEIDEAIADGWADSGMRGLENRDPAKTATA